MACNIIYVHELPYQPRRNLCRILDADRRWEELGGIHMNYDVTSLTLIGQAIHRDKSPTWELLNKYSESNGTIKRLFIMLAKMDHQRGMSVLKPYVEEKYHCLLRDESTMLTVNFTSSKKDTSGFPFSQISALSSRTSHLSSSHHQSKVHSYKQDESSALSKLKNNFVNINKELSSVSLHSKLNSLNVQPVHSKTPDVKRSPNLSHIKKTSNNIQEVSTSDNCVSGKIKEQKKVSKQEVVVKEDKPRRLSSHFACAVSLNTQEECLPDIMRIPYQDIHKATDGFNKDRILGRGGFGTVYKGEWKGTSVAIKRLTPRHSGDDPSQHVISMKQSLNELNVLKTCRFDHILPLYAVSLDGENPCLIYQLMVNGSLEDRLLLKNHTPPLTWSQRSHIAECMTKGLNYLHTTPGKPLIHGDIKSANILLDANMDAKIGDFGLTREGPGCQDTHVKVSSVHGTECYLPPEYLRQKHLSPQVDIYCYGIVLLEIATGLRPFDPKRGKGKRLADFVCFCKESGHLEALRDVKAGEEKMIWFRELIRIGQICSSDEKKKRPPMDQILVQFEKIKQEMSMMDKIRRHSSDRGNSILPTDLTPMGLQMFFDFQKSSQSRMTANNKPPGSIKELSLDNSIPETHVKEVAKTCEHGSATEADDSYHPKETCTTDSNSESVLQEMNVCAGQDKSDSNGKAPLPLLTVLQLQVSSIDDVSEYSSQSVSSISSSNITSDK